jgi:2-polyprenyl-6-methoxyphenol hydroxylase-like FAD-dependent oxidoreductase
MTKSVLVVGGGIGGLVLARALAQLGVDVIVLERAATLRAVGAGITLGANAMRILQSLGLRAGIEAAGREMTAAAITDERGRTLAAGDLAALEERFGKAFAIHRGALHEVLAKDLARAGRATVEVRCGVTATAIALDDAGAATVTLSDGSTLRPHAVIGADGLYSSVRSMVIGEHAPRYAGYTCWRWTAHVPGGLRASVEMWGRGLRVGLVPLAGDDVYAFFVANAPKGTWEDRSLRRGAAVRARFAGFGGEMPRVLAAIPDDAELLHHDIEEIEVPTWSRGSVGLLGDAAHAMTPNFGQGAAMAIEDAIVLARELVAHNDASTALQTYERRRRPRVDDLQRGARRLGVVAQWSGPVATWARNLALRCAPASSSERALEKIVSYVP